MHIQIRKSIVGKANPKFHDNSVFVANRSYSHADGPFEIDDKKAAELLKAGLADAVIQMPYESAHKAVAPKSEMSRR